MESRSFVNKEEFEEVLKELGPKFKHIDPHVIILLYSYVKKRELERMKS